MPISGPASYVETTEQFLAHWELANAELPPTSPLLVPSLSIPPGPAIALATLETLYDSLLVKRSELQSKLNSQEIARGAINNLKTVLQGRAVLFNEAVRGQLPGSIYEEALPDVPGILMSQGPFVEPLDDAADVWEKINADAAIGADIVLSDGTTQGSFAADVETLKTLYRNFNKAEVQTGVTRSQRNRIQDQIYPILKGYRGVLPTKFPKGHELIATLPKLSPEAGSTPEPVTNVVTEYLTASNQGHVTFTPSTSAGIVRYLLMVTPGPVYSEDDDTVAGEVPATGPYEFFTTESLGTPGMTISVKVVAINDTGNQAGSDAITITRPDDPSPP